MGGLAMGLNRRVGQSIIMIIDIPAMLAPSTCLMKGWKQ